MFQPYLSSFAPLSPRETEVIELIAEGLTDKEIAARLGITPRTVIEHLVNIRSKLGASNRVAAVYRNFHTLIRQRARLIESCHAPTENDMTTQTNTTLRPPNPDADIPVHASMSYQLYTSTWSGLPLFIHSDTEQSMAEDFRQNISTHKHRWRVAEDADGNMLGYSELYHEPWDSVGGHVLNLTVKSEAYKQGIGTELYDDVLRATQEAGSNDLYTLASEGNPSAMRFAQKRGFAYTGQYLGFELDLVRFDAGRSAHVIEFSNQAGVRITSLAEFGDSEDVCRNLLQLYVWVNALDLPGHSDKPPWDSFEQFSEVVCGSRWYQPEGQIAAIDERKREWIGMAATTVNALVVNKLHIGVDRRHRHNSMID